jgi:hypothetical protein
MVIVALERLNVPYMVVGSMASIAYGEPRFTQDVDVVIDPTESQAAALCQAFASDEFYASEEAARAAVRSRGQFNIIHSRSGNKVDLVILSPGAWGQSEISRRVRAQILPGLEGYRARPEDVIIGKMLYYQEGGSEKHLRDITGILKVTADDVDREYISRWAAVLGLTEIWQAVLARLES